MLKVISCLSKIERELSILYLTQQSFSNELSWLSCSQEHLKFEDKDQQEM